MIKSIIVNLQDLLPSTMLNTEGNLLKSVPNLQIIDWLKIV